MHFSEGFQAGSRSHGRAKPCSVPLTDGRASEPQTPLLRALPALGALNRPPCCTRVGGPPSICAGMGRSVTATTWLGANKTAGRQR